MSEIQCIKGLIFFRSVIWLSLHLNFRFYCHCVQCPQPPRDAVRKQEKNILENFFSSVLSQLEKYHPSKNLKLINLGIFQSWKLRILIEKSFQFLLTYISLQILWADMG